MRWNGLPARDSVPCRPHARQLTYNRGMNRLDLLLPFSLTPPELARDLQRELHTPSLAMLLGRGKRVGEHASDEFARALPHEYWLLGQRFGQETPHGNSGHLPLATHLAKAKGITLEAGFWFILQPFHLHVARDHLVLTDPRQLKISEDESHILFDTAQSLFAEVGKTLLYADAGLWLLHADDWHELQTASPDAACGHNVDIWMAQGERARDWRRLQNEVQMHWHNHAINDERAARGQKPINSVWLWGGAATEDVDTRRFDVIHTSSNAGSAATNGLLASLQAHQASGVDALLASTTARPLLLLDDLTETILAEDWAEWIARLNAMETQWFAPLLEALRTGRIRQFGITLGHHAALRHIDVSASSLRKFWKKPSLSVLAA